MAWNQLFGGGHPKGTLADIADKYPQDLAKEQNRNIGLGAVMPLANMMRPTVDAARSLYNMLPDSSTTQAIKLREKLNPTFQETHPGVKAALTPQQLLVPSNLPKNDTELMEIIYQQSDTPNQAQPQSTSKNNLTTAQQPDPAQGAALPPPAVLPTPGSDGNLSYLGNKETTDGIAGRSKHAQKIAPIISGLVADGFSPVDTLSRSVGPRSGVSYLGPNDIYVKERLGTPKEYTAAVQDNQNATVRGQQVGLEQSFGAKGYAPNDATKSGMENGGAITEYAVPGKGTATFYGQRQGGGTLSVLGGRTAEEQAAIDERVKQIDSQTAAMRGLRNAGRLAQGGITVEQEDQQNAMAAMMNRLASPPDMSGFEDRQKALMGQLSAAKDIRGFGKRGQRKDAIDAAQIGLGQLANEQQLATQSYNQNRNAAMQAWQGQQQQEAAMTTAQQKALSDQGERMRDQSNKDRDYEARANKDMIEAARNGNYDEYRRLEYLNGITKQAIELGRADPNFQAYYKAIQSADPTDKTVNPVDASNKMYWNLDPMPKVGEKQKPPEGVYSGTTPGVAQWVDENGMTTQIPIQQADIIRQKIATRNR